MAQTIRVMGFVSVASNLPSWWSSYEMAFIESRHKRILGEAYSEEELQAEMEAVMEAGVALRERAINLWNPPTPR